MKICFIILFFSIASHSPTAVASPLSVKRAISNSTAAKVVNDKYGIVATKLFDAEYYAESLVRQNPRRRRYALSAHNLLSMNDNDDEENPKIPFPITRKFREFLDSENCSRFEFEQNVTATGSSGDTCRGTVKNHLCYGNCNSIDVPATTRNGSSYNLHIRHYCALNEKDYDVVYVNFTCRDSSTVNRPVKIFQSCQCQHIH